MLLVELTCKRNARSALADIFLFSLSLSKFFSSQNVLNTRFR